MATTNASNTLQTRLKMKYDTYANWTKNDPVLLAGEIAVAVIPASSNVAQTEPTVLIKVGDGTKKFSELGWVSALGADVYTWAKKATVTEAIQYRMNKESNTKFTLQVSTNNGTSWTDVGTSIDVSTLDTDTTYKVIEDTTAKGKFYLQVKAPGASAFTTQDTIDFSAKFTAWDNKAASVTNNTTAGTSTVSATNAAGTTTSTTVYTKDKTDTLLGNKVDKSTGYSLAKITDVTGGNSTKIATVDHSTDVEVATKSYADAIKGVADTAVQSVTVGGSETKSGTTVALGDAAAKTVTTSVADNANLPTAAAVKTYVDNAVAGATNYLGTAASASALSTTAKKGDFFRATGSWGSGANAVHPSDLIIAEKNNPTKTVDGTNYSVIHGELDTDTTYTFTNGTEGSFSVTPSGGSAQTVTVAGVASTSAKGLVKASADAGKVSVDTNGIMSVNNFSDKADKTNNTQTIISKEFIVGNDGSRETKIAYGQITIGRTATITDENISGFAKVSATDMETDSLKLPPNGRIDFDLTGSSLTPDKLTFTNHSPETTANAIEISGGDVQATVANVTHKLSSKIDATDVSALGKSGDVKDMTQTSGKYVILDCGSSSTNIA